MLTDRQKEILGIAVKLFVLYNEPVGSLAIMNLLSTHVSSATIRNEMAHLENLGLLEQPHTSAGRVPTQKGYRYYVDEIMHKRDVSQKDKTIIDNELNSLKSDTRKTLDEAADFLAELTGCVTIVSKPKIETTWIKKIDIVPLGIKRHLVIVLTSDGSVETEVCRLAGEVPLKLIEGMIMFLNTRLCGTAINELDMDAVNRLVDELSAAGAALTPIIFTVYNLSKILADKPVYVKGEGKLKQIGEERAKEIVNYLKQSDDAHSLLYKNTDGVEVIFGYETNQSPLSNTSMILAKYNTGHHRGTIGIVGADGIDFERIIPSIEYFADKLSEILLDNEEEE